MELDDGRSRGVGNGKGSRAWRLGATFSLRLITIAAIRGASDPPTTVYRCGEVASIFRRLDPVLRWGPLHRSNGAYGLAGPEGRQKLVGPIIGVAVTQEVGDDGGVAPRRRGGCESSGGYPMSNPRQWVVRTLFASLPSWSRRFPPPCEALGQNL
ncbi:hypothetical protein U1Q18_025726 [Sarracenia purpurea var. burkii]